MLRPISFVLAVMLNADDCIVADMIKCDFHIPWSSAAGISMSLNVVRELFGSTKVVGHKPSFYFPLLTHLLLVQDETGTLWRLNGDVVKLRIHNVTTSDERGFPMHGFFTRTSDCTCFPTAANWQIGLRGWMATLAAQMLMEEKVFVKADYEARTSWFKVCVGVFSKSLFLLVLVSLCHYC